jgi:hypothetical protein
MARKRIIGAAAAALSLPLLLLIPISNAGAESQAPAQAAAAAPTTGTKSDIRELTRKNFTFEGQNVSDLTTARVSARAAAPQTLAAAETPPVGTVRQWLGLDDFNGRLYRKDYVLRGVGQKIEVWVALDRSSRPVTAATRCRTRPT